MRFGDYDTTAPLARSGPATTAHLAGPATPTAAGTACCVKLVDRKIDPDAADDLLAAALLQTAMADRSPAWAPVHQFGTAADGTAFAVTDRHARSAQTLVDAGRRLTSAELRTVIMAVLDGLIAVQAWHGRPHGNVKPANVLLGRRIAPGTVHLTDPAAAAHAGGSLTRAPDAKAVGRLIYALVTARPAAAAPSPPPFDKPWAALGPSGRSWYALCRSLLDPRGSAAPDLDAVLTRVAAIRPTRRRLPRSFVVVPVVALVLAVGYDRRDAFIRAYNGAAESVRTTWAEINPPPKPRKSRRVLHPATRRTLSDTPGSTRP